MGPLDIVSLAAAIAQFVDIACRALSSARQIYGSASGMQKEIEELQLVVQNIKQFLEESDEMCILSKNDRAICNLAGQCEELAESLFEQLKALRMRRDAKYKALESAKVSLLTIWRRDDIISLRKRLCVMERQLRTSILHATMKQQHSSIMSVLDGIRRENDQASLETHQKIDHLGQLLMLAGTVEANQQASYQVTLTQIRQELERLAREGKAVEERQAIIQSLVFKAMKKRHDQIDRAHFKTLHWVFDESKTSLGTWLKQWGGIYWINGKAGSGKSTLMKYIAENRQTEESLKYWAGSHKLFITHFYFWNAGSEMQKSQQGLLQSMLYQILRCDPCLVAIACPEYRGSEPWSVAELKAVLRRLVGAASSARFCFFIDGLDEYAGDQWEMADILKELVQWANVKLCAASRPWTAFEQTLNSQKQMLVIHDLTYNDITIYVNHMLSGNHAYKELATQQPECLELEKEIALMARGVWLWVFLVIRDLTQDIRAGETYRTLKTRLYSLPLELDEYFERIMNRIDPFFREETAHIFLIAVESARPFPLFALSYLQHGPDGPSFAKNGAVTPMSPEGIERANRNLAMQLQTRCGDLLIVSTDETADCFFRQTVDFLHRTVRDFLRDNYHTELHMQRAPDFDGKETLCQMILAILKQYPVEDANNFRLHCNGLISLVDELLYYAYELEQLDRASLCLFGVLDEVDRVMSTHARYERNHWTNVRDCPKGAGIDRSPWHERGQCTFLALAVQARLHQYVAYVLERDPIQLRSKKGRPLLDYALRPTRVTPTDLPYHHEREVVDIDKELVRTLLSHGADPNQPIWIYDGQTPWNLFVSFCCSKFEARQPQQMDIPRQNYFEIIHLLVNYGADLDHVARLQIQLPGRAKKTPRYKQDVALEQDSMPARELLELIFTPDQMLDLISTRQLIQSRSPNQQVGWFNWTIGLIGGKR